jgi:hypothetical protein
MSTKIAPLKAGLAALGLIWTSADHAGAQEAAPPIPATAPSNAPTFAVLLLSNGRIIQGNVSLDKTGNDYLLAQKGGTIRFAKKDVERRFASMKELYQYKVSNLAQRDTSERMQLARWCLENHMDAEAKEHLKLLLTLNPNDTRAERMIASLDASAERMAENRDPEVKTTSATVGDPAPRELSPAVRSRALGQMGRAVGPPVVFDLPAPLARKRASEYAQTVHPVLQQACASCHNHTYQGDFQLIQTTSRREWTPDVVLSNLDTTLRLVNRDNPLQSDVLAYGINPHGPNTRAIFHGPNDPRYQALTRWLKGLAPTGPVNKTGYAPRAAVSPARTQGAVAEGFGADRFPGQPAPNAAPTPAPIAPNGMPNPSMAAELYQFDATSPRVPDGVRFDPPFVPGGVMPALPGKPGQAAPPAPTAAKTAAVALPDLPPGTPVPPPDDVIPPTNRPKKKKSNLDPALLEQLLKSRQQP